MNKIFYLLLLLSLYVVVGCEKNKDKDPDKTFLVYMIGNNNLASYMRTNINSLKDVESGAYVPNYTEVGKGGNILLVYKNLTNEDPMLLRISLDKNGRVFEEIVYEFEEHNSLDPDVMRDVLNKVDALFPAKEKGLLFSSHATGWIPEGFYGSEGVWSAPAYSMLRYDHIPGSLNGPQEESFGEDNGREMDIKDLPKAFSKKYSYIIFDCCLMGNIEVAYELRDCADYIVSSSAEVLAAGFPYNQIVEPLLKNEKADVKKVAEVYFDFYNLQEEENSRSATISLVKTAELPALAAAARAIMDRDRSRILELDMDELQGFHRHNQHWYYDMGQFYNKLSTNKSELEAFNAALFSVVAYKAATPYFLRYSRGFEIKTFSGLSNYVPNPPHTTLDPYYTGYEWNNAAGVVK